MLLPKFKLTENTFMPYYKTRFDLP